LEATSPDCFYREIVRLESGQPAGILGPNCFLNELHATHRTWRKPTVKTPKIAIIVLAILAAFLFWLARNPAAMLSLTGRGGDVSMISENIDVALEETRFQATSGDLESQYDLASQLVMLEAWQSDPEDLAEILR
jgi:hypothetical protein